jgi:uncharacterized protein (TIGR03437 family)
MCASSGLQVFKVPRPTVAPDGVAITFTPVSGGTGTNALLWYEDNLGSGACQLAGILQSTVPVGTYNVTVTNGTASAPFQATVVKSKFALFTQDSTGSGLAAAQDQVSTNYYLNRLTTGNIAGTAIAPAYPGEYMVAYGTGLGPVPAADDNDAMPVDDLSKTDTIQAVVGGVNIPVLFAGRAGYAGEDQINFQLPANVPTGCTVSFQLSVNGNLSPATTLSIAPTASAPACVLPGYTTSQLQALDNGGTITVGGFDLVQSNETVPGEGSLTSASASGAFTQITGFELASLGNQPSFSETTVGSCTVVQVTVTNTGTVSAGGVATFLDAGVVTLSGPGASNLNKTAMTDTGGVYTLSIGSSLPGGGTGQLVAGTYTVSGAGGTGVGSFNASITLGTPIAVTLPSTVIRSQGLPLTWTGGNPSDIVTITGYSGTTSGTGASAVTTASQFTCTTTAGTGGFTVSSQVLDQLPATQSAASGGAGYLSVSSGPSPVSFAPVLTGTSSTVNATYSAAYSTIGFPTYQ